MYVDHVVRKEKFLKDHPSVVILSPRQLGGMAWQAIWDEANGSNTVTRYELRDLLDELEERFPD